MQRIYLFLIFKKIFSSQIGFCLNSRLNEERKENNEKMQKNSGELTKPKNLNNREKRKMTSLLPAKRCD